MAIELYILIAAEGTITQGDFLWKGQQTICYFVIICMGDGILTEKSCG